MWPHRMNIGHRLAHCCDGNLPPHLQERQRQGPALAYFVCDLEQTGMTERDLHALFGEVDATVDALPMGMAFADDAKLESRQIQRARFRGLTKEQWLDLRALWSVHYQEREDAKREATQARLAELV